MDQNRPQSIADRIIFNPHERAGSNRNLRDEADGVVLVGQLKTPALNVDSIELWLVTDVELISAEWMFQFSIENESNGERTKEETTEIGMKVTTGKEVSDSVSASAGFSGWGFSAQVNASTETRTFNSLETSSVRTMRDTYTCPPHSSIFVYKRRYTFRCKLWMHEKRTNTFVAPDGKGKYLGEYVHEIIANQELISSVALSSHGRVTNNPPSGLLDTSNPVDKSKSPWWNPAFMALKNLYPWAGFRGFAELRP
jgi:hypothetical protein